VTVEAIYENGVFRPLQPLDIPEHARVRVTVVPVACVRRERRRVAVDTETGRAIAEDPEFSLYGVPPSGG